MRLAGKISIVSCISLISVILLILYLLISVNYQRTDYWISSVLFSFEDEHLQQDSLNVTWISRFGIISLCDQHDDIFTVFRKHPKQHISSPSKFDNISDNDIIYISQFEPAFTDFVDNILPNITHYFSIIALGQDTTFPIGFAKTRIKMLMNNPFLIHFYIRNFIPIYGKRFSQSEAELFNRKVSPFPIGIHYFNTIEFPVSSYINYGHNILGSISTHNENINKLRNNKLKIRPIEQREMKVYVDYILTTFEDHKYNLFMNDNCTLNFDEMYTKYSRKGMASAFNRKAIVRSNTYFKIRKNPNFVFGSRNENIFGHWVHKLSKMTQYNLFIERSKCVFLLVVGGNGIDTFRMWEGLIFGHITIVMTSKYDDLYLSHPQLPIVIVNTYEDINQSMLHYWYNKYKDLTSLNNNYTAYSLTNQYWIDYVRKRSAEAINELD
eukprot:213171_1